MAELKDWSTTASSNNSAPPNGWPENQSYSSVNDCGREMMAVLARWFKDSNGTLTTGGSSNAYTLTPNRTISAYADGDCYLIEANHTNTGAATLNVSALGAKSIVTPDGSALNSGAIVSGGRYFVTYDGTNFQIHGTGGNAALSANNTFTGNNTFSGYNTHTSTDGGASSGPTIELYRNSASPAAADAIGRIPFTGNDSGGNYTTYGAIFGQINSPTDGAETGRIYFQTIVAGASTSRAFIGGGLVIGSPTGSDKGAGTINAEAIYDDNTLLTDYVFDAVAEGSIDVAKWDNRVPNREIPGRPVEVRTHEPARRFAQRLDDLDPKAYGQKWKASRRLPAFDHKAGEQISVGEYAQRLLETCEVQAVHIDKLLERIEELEARVNNGRPN